MTNSIAAFPILEKGEPNLDKLCQNYIETLVKTNQDLRKFSSTLQSITLFFEGMKDHATKSTELNSKIIYAIQLYQTSDASIVKGCELWASKTKEVSQNFYEYNQLTRKFFLNEMQLVLEIKKTLGLLSHNKLLLEKNRCSFEKRGVKIQAALMESLLVIPPIKVSLEFKSRLIQALQIQLENISKGFDCILLTNQKISRLSISALENLQKIKFNRHFEPLVFITAQQEILPLTKANCSTDKHRSRRQVSSVEKLSSQTEQRIFFIFDIDSDLSWASRACGYIHIIINPREQLYIRFNLNKRRAINYKSLLEKLKNYLNENAITPKDVAEIIYQLKNIQIQRANDINPVIGVIRLDSTYFDEIIHGFNGSTSSKIVAN